MEPLTFAITKILEQTLRALAAAQDTAAALDRSELINLRLAYATQIQLLEELHLTATGAYATALILGDEQPTFSWDEDEIELPLRLYFGAEGDVQEFESLEAARAYVARHVAIFEYAQKCAGALFGAPDPGPAPESHSTDWEPTVLVQDGSVTGYSIGNIVVTYELDLPNITLYLAYIMALIWQLQEFDEWAEIVFSDIEDEMDADAEVAA